MRYETLWIDTPAQLAEACAQWQTREWISVDTESVRINTYHAHLCLVQIGDGELNACIDPLAIEDLAPMWALMANPDILKVFHASGQDFELVVEHTGRTPAPVFDTQIAATLIGLGDQLGYAGLVEKRLGLPVDKSLSRTDWARRPLTQPEIDYAADDVRHLSALFPALREDVIARGRLAWLEEDCLRLTEPTRYQVLPENAWSRLKGLNRLTPDAQGARRRSPPGANSKRRTATGPANGFSTTRRCTAWPNAIPSAWRRWPPWRSCPTKP